MHGQGEWREWIDKLVLVASASAASHRDTQTLDLPNSPGWGALLLGRKGQALQHRLDGLGGCTAACAGDLKGAAWADCPAALPHCSRRQAQRGRPVAAQGMLAIRSLEPDCMGSNPASRAALEWLSCTAGAQEQGVRASQQRVQTLEKVWCKRKSRGCKPNCRGCEHESWGREPMSRGCEAGESEGDGVCLVL